MMLDPNFARSVVLILAHDEEGTIGVILDRPTDDPVSAHLPTVAPVASFPEVVFSGGPVEPQVAVALGPVTLGTVGSIDDVETLDLDEMPVGPVRVFAGYAGWSPGQLESELEGDGWVVAKGEWDDIFTSDPDTLWSRVLKRQGGTIAMLATFPLDPEMN
ncbi:MAG: hypothetical protein GEU79_04025 [Acidimicrobiia bacterium]|nr:hypothetical protein [Acidimicrobiia bacterium]